MTAAAWTLGHEQPDGPPTPTTAERLMALERGDDLERLEVYTVSDLAEHDSADESYLIGEGILTVGGKRSSTAPSGKGKTTLMHDLMAVWPPAGPGWASTPSTRHGPPYASRASCRCPRWPATPSSSSRPATPPTASGSPG